MRRRALLSTVAAAGLAGCNALVGDGDRTTRQPLAVDTGTPTPTRRPLADLDTEPTPVARTGIGPTRMLVTLRARGVPEGLGVRAGFLGDATEERPLLLWVGVQNRTDDETTLDFGGTPPVSTYRVIAEAGKQTVYLVPVGMDEPTEGLHLWNACWKARDRGVVEEPDEVRSVTVPPGETVGRPYALATMRGAGVCLPTGQYRIDGDGGWTLGLSVFSPAERQSLSSRFSTSDVPSLSVEGTAVTRWFHQVAGSGPPVYARPTDEQVGSSPGRFSLVLYNYGRGSVDVGEGWRLYHLHSTGWKQVAPFGKPSRWVATVRPGETYGQDFRFSNRPRLERDPPSSVGGLGPGRYAVVLPGERWENGSPVERVAFAAAVDLVGNETTLSPSEAVSETTHDGSMLFVDALPGSGESTQVSVERLDDDPDAVLVLEQVNQFQLLRDALAYLHGDDELDRVDLRLPTDRIRRFVGAVERLGIVSGDGSIRFTFDDAGYRVETEPSGSATRQHRKTDARRLGDG